MLIVPELAIDAALSKRMSPPVLLMIPELVMYVELIIPPKMLEMLVELLCMMPPWLSMVPP